ncbi:hypothetical protein [Shewanella surugensis]|uniref:Uncharacterized protein n=1 Tax=Shewanella surugensis TaxID=212020 RepID=A0ABT0L835_9GAMM|nr:hypothetical protein [Shewanella surugensis]MCL1123336.1 hypothetical protein [Shewanella surugensis]
MGSLSFMFLIISVSSVVSVFVCLYSAQQQEERAEYVEFINGRAQMAHDLVYDLGEAQAVLNGTEQYGKTKSLLNSTKTYFRNCQTHNVIAKREVVQYEAPSLKIVG